MWCSTKNSPDGFWKKTQDAKHAEIIVIVVGSQFFSSSVLQDFSPKVTKEKTDYFYLSKYVSHIGITVLTGTISVCLSQGLF